MVEMTLTVMSVDSDVLSGKHFVFFYRLSRMTSFTWYKSYISGLDR